MIKNIYALPVFLLVFFFFVSPSSANESELFTSEIFSKSNQSFAVNYSGENSGVSIVEFTGNYDKDITDVSNIAARKSVTETLYQSIPDLYDFLVIFTQFPVDSGEASAFTIIYENDVSGIGLPLFDNSIQMGSERLQATIDMTELSDWELDPSHRLYDSTLDVLIHEMMHRWGVHISFIDHNGQSSNLLRGRDDNHWNYFADSNASIMYGANWHEISTGVFETRGISKSLSPLDLYLMGFNEPSMVSDFFIIDSGVPGSIADLPSPIGTLVNGSRVDISIQDIIAEEGIRIPNSEESQHSFNFKFVLLKRPDDQLDEDRLGSLVVLQRKLQQRFVVETQGVGAIVYPEFGDYFDSTDPERLSYDLINNLEVDLDSAVNFIESKFDGSSTNWRDKFATQVRDTAMSVHALSYLEVGGEDINSAVQWLNSYEAINNDELAWLLLSNQLTDANKTRVISHLINQVNTDGGWGLTVGSESSSFDTTLVLWALVHSQGSNFNITSNTLMYVLNQINDDGGIGFSAGGKSSITSSAILLLTIYELTSDSALEQGLIDFIISQQLPDNGFGSTESSAYETALVIKALSESNNQDHLQITEDAKTKLRTMQSVDGSFEGSIYTTALALNVLFNDQQSNLSLGEVSLNSSQAVEGEQVAINYQIIHQGEAQFNNVSISLLLNQQIVASSVIDEIESNSSLNGQLILNSNGFNGLLDLEFVVDLEDALTESNEYDNSTGLTLDVLPKTNLPELAFDQSSIDVSPLMFSTLPFQYDVSFRVGNLSYTDLDNVKVSLVQVTGDSVEVELHSYTQNIAAGLDSLFDFNVELASISDGLDFVIVIDPNNEVDEVNEGNNRFNFQLDKIPTVDLSIGDSQISIPSQIIAGQQAPIDFEFSNLGTQTAPGFDVQVILNNSNGSEILFETAIAELAGGETIERQFTWVPTENGEFNIDFIVDTVNAVAEVNENNNSISIPVVVTLNTITNLKIEDSDISISPDPGLAGQLIELTALIKNTSSTESGSFDLNFYQSRTNQANTILAETTDNPSIPASGEMAVSTLIDSNNDYGEITYIVELDPNNEILEIDENDNIGFQTFRVLNKPDAMVSSGGFSLTPSAPVLGEALGVEATIVNLGEQDLVDVEVKLFTKSGQNIQEVGNHVIPLVSSGQQVPTVFDFTFPNDPSIQELVIKVDPDNEVDEINENNNEAILIIENQSREFYLTELHFSPNGDGVKDSTQIVFNFEIEDAYQIIILDEFDQLVREFPIINSTTNGDYYWDGRDQSNNVVGDASYTVEVKGLNFNLSRRINVVVDTNRTTLLEAIKYDQGTFFDLGCTLDELTGQVDFSHDGKYLYTKEFKDRQGIIHNGFYRIKTDGKSIESLLPNGFFDDHSINYYFVSNTGKVVIYVTNQFNGNNEIWTFNALTKAFQQLNTSFSNQFSIQLTTDLFSLVKITLNNNHSYYKVPHNELLNVENMIFNGDGSNLDRVKKLNQGWLWVVGTTDNTYRYYYSSFEDSLNPQLLAEDSSSINFSVSADGRYFTIYSEEELSFKYFQATNNQLNAMVDYQMESQLHQVYSQILRNNNLLLVKDSSIVIYNSSGTEIFSTPHGFNLSYFQQVIIDRFGSLNSMTYGWEAGVIDYTFNDLENLEINFNDIKVNQADEDVLYIDLKSKLEGLLVFLDANVDISDIVSFYSKEDIKLRIDFSQLENIVVDELSEIDIENAKFYERLSPLFLISESSYYKGFLDDEDYPSDYFWSNFGIDKYFPKSNESSYIKKSLINSNYLPYGISCSDSGDKFKGVFQSNANLTSFINSSVNKGIVELNGSSFDKHFSGYIIEWKSLDQPNSTWQTLKSSESEVQDDFFMFWTPVISGHYLLRLTSFDKAGNQVSDSDDVFIGDVNLDIINTDVYPKHFSPNGDGVLDNVTIAYEVLQSSDVDIEISNSTGEIVRTINREYLAGQLDSVNWNGLNDQGQNLPDGIYTISFNNYAYQVVLDTTAPEVFIRMAENQNAMAYIWPGYPWASGIKSYWFGSDLYTQEGQLKINSMLEKYNNQNQEWEPVSGISCGINSTEYFSYDLYEGDKYRCYTYDLAGNGSAFSELTIDFDPLYSRSLLKNLQSEQITISYDAFKCPKDYGYTETNAECNESYTINHRDHPEIADWNVEGELFLVLQSFSAQEINQVKMTTSYIPENSVDNLPVVSDRFIELVTEELLVQELELNEEDLYREDMFPSNMFSRFKKYYLNLQQEHFPTTDSVISVVFQFQYVNGETHDVELKIEFAQKSIERFFSSNELFTRGIDHFMSFLPELNPNDEQITASLESVLSNVEFNVDKNYWIFISTKYENISNSLVTVSETDLDPIQYLPIFEAIHLHDNSDAGHVIQLFEVDSDDCQIPLVTYSGVREDGTIITIQKGLSGSLPLCVDDLQMQQLFYANNQCDSNAETDDLVRIQIDGLIGLNSAIPASLEIYRLVDDNEELLFAETNVQVNLNNDGKWVYQTYFEVDKSFFAAGSHLVFIRFIDVEGNRYEEVSKVLVQNQTVSSSVVRPNELQKFCALDSESGDIQVPIQVLFDNNGPKNLNASQFTNGAFQSELTGYSNLQRIQSNALNSTDKLFLEGNLYENEFILKAPSYAGQTTVMFDVINSTGVSQCESVNIEVDSLIDADVSYLDQEHYISPLGSGHHLLVQFAEITAYEPLNVKVNVRQVFDNSPDVVVGNLYDMSLESGENIEMSWNGEIDGQLLPDGRYDLTVDIIDSCDILKREVVTIIIDSTAPQISFTNPVNGQMVNSIEEVRLLVEDNNLDRKSVV